MRAIASVIANRARMLGVTPEQVVQNRNEFNAYGKPMPAGTAKLTGMAQEAIDYVDVNGSVHTGTFYATPAATRNLPRGLQAIAETTGHRYFSDPQNRSIGTAIGYRQPSAAAISLPATGPVPTPAPRAVASNAAAVPQGSRLTAAGSIGGIVPTAAPRVASAAQPSRQAPLGFGPARQVQPNITPGKALAPLGPIGTGVRVASMPTPARSVAPSLAATRLLGRNVTNLAEKGPRLAAPSATRASTLSPSQDANLAGRLGDAAQTRIAASLPLGATASLAPATKSLGAVRAIGGLIDGTLGSVPAKAPATPSRVATAPQTLGPVGTAKALSPVDRQAQALSPASTATPAAIRTMAPISMGPPMSPQASLALDVADQRAARAAAQAKAAVTAQPTAALVAPVQRTPIAAALPALAAPVDVPARRVAAVAPVQTAVVKPAQVVQQQPVRVAPAIRQVAAPVSRVASPVARSTGLGLPSIPSAPRQPSMLGRMGSVLGANKAAIAGGLIGGVTFGPIGGVVGGLIGNAVGRGPSPSGAAQAAMASGSFDGFSHGGGGNSRTGASIGTGGAASAASRGSGIGPGGSGPGDPSSKTSGRDADQGNRNTSSKSGGGRKR